MNPGSMRSKTKCGIGATNVDVDRQGTERPPLVVCTKCRRKEGARAMMTPKERMEMHKQIERENARKLKEWKEGGRK